MEDKLSTIQYQAVSDTVSEELVVLFQALVANGDEAFFHPHPLTREYVGHLSVYKGEDLYFVQFFENKLTGYGMLRGWDEGYTIPSLGIAIHPRYRGQGLAAHFMRYLHGQARNRGVHTIRLTVEKSNTCAIQLYEILGYRLSRKNDAVFEGFLELP